MPKSAAKILIIDDDPDVLTAARVVLRQCYETVITESNPNRITALVSQSVYDVILLDMNFTAGRLTGNEGLYWLKQIINSRPEQQVIMITAYGDINLAVDAMKHGAADFIVKPWQNEKLEATVEALVKRKDKKTGKEVAPLPHNSANPFIANASTIVGSSDVFTQTIDSATRVAPTDAAVLLLGENGTGKGSIAQLIHDKSLRATKPFVKVDVGSIASNLFESELFGHVKGAFTDARDDRMGRIQMAHGGTLFLDEIGNLPLALQTKLLSVIQNQEIIPVGSNVPISIDIRLITATNADIYNAMATGSFRQDLLYRINTVELTVPALRQRLDDLPSLANHFLTLYCTKYRKEEKSLTSDALAYLQDYRWPGNVRELQHAIERAVIMSNRQALTREDFSLVSRTNSTLTAPHLNLDELEKNAIIKAIEKHKGNLTNVARELGVGRTTLYRKMTRYGLEK